MIHNWFSWFGPILLIVLIALVAFTSLISTKLTLQVVNSVYFIGLILIVVVVGHIGNLFSFKKNNFIAYSRIIIHLGLAIGLTGLYLNQTRKQNGYLFLEASGIAKNYYLSYNLKAIDELPVALRIDSITNRYQKGFNQAPIIWLGYNNTQIILNYNHPVYFRGIQFLLSKVIEPGFPNNYEILINNQRYSLLHNQKVRLEDGPEIWSYAFDPETKKIGLMIGNHQEWLTLGDTLILANSTIVLESVDFAQHQGTIILVKDISLRFIIYLGFSLMLIGLIPILFKRREL